MKYVLFISSFLVIFFSCGNTNSQNNETEKCTTSPSPIFSDTMKIVEKQNFEANGQDSNEEVFLKNGLKLEVLQSGCKYLRQEIRITRSGDFLEMEDPFWMSVAYQTLGLLSEQSPQLAGLQQYATIIAQHSSSAKLGQAFFPEPSLSISVDKIVNEQEGSSIIVMQEIDPNK